MRKTSISTAYFRDGKIDWGMIESSGFQFAEARCEDILPEDEPAEIENVKRELEKHSLKLSSLHSFLRGVDISSEDKWLRTKSLRELEKSIVTASRLSCRNVIVHLSGRLKRGCDRRQCLENGFASIREAEKMADDFSVELLLENLPSGYLMSNENEIDEALSRGTKLCFDLGHALITKIDPLKFCSNKKNSIKAAHIHFNDSLSDSHSAFRGDDDLKLVKEMSELLLPDATFVLEMKTEERLSGLYLTIEKISGNNIKPEGGI